MLQQFRARPPLAGVAALAVILATAPSAESLACGFHDDVTLARGIMNWIYPDALHVVGAISTAVAERRLPASNVQPAQDLFGARYRATVRSLERFGDAMRPGPGAPPMPFSLVLVEPMLWTRFDGEQGQPRAQVHVSGPQPGDLVLISGETVVQEIANGRLSLDEAYRLGLVRLYGSDDQRSRFQAAYKAAGVHGHADPDRAGARDAITIQFPGGSL